MAEQIVRWRSLNGNEYSSEEVAMRHDKIYEQTSLITKTLGTPRHTAYMIVTNWDELKKIMEEDQ